MPQGPWGPLDSTKDCGPQGPSGFQLGSSPEQKKVEVISQLWSHIFWFLLNPPFLDEIVEDKMPYGKGSNILYKCISPSPMGFIYLGRKLFAYENTAKWLIISAI